jgi:alkylation response protein AidB-like acyl-CoA dehydrogenase
MVSTPERPTATPGYSPERVDSLPFGNAEKSGRYATARYEGATGLNWWEADPSLQFLVRYYMEPEALAWAEPHLRNLGAIMGGPISEWADVTDKNPPKLVKYDRWGHDISKVELPDSVVRAKRLLWDNNFSDPAIRREAESRGISLRIPNTAYSYMLCQADIGLSCAMGTGGNMVEAFVDQFATPEMRDFLMPKIEAGEFRGDTAQSLTERTGGSDLGAMETTATPDGDAYRLNGLKWFVSNADGNAFVVLAKVEGGADDIHGVENFLVLKQRRDGSRNGIRIRRLKDKLGTKAVASAEVEFVDAEAFILSGASPDGSRTGDGRGASRMMELTNSARLGVAMMGLGCARRALVESIQYARVRQSWGRPLIEHPLMRRKLAEMIVDVEATQALVFDGYGTPNALRQDRESRALRLGPPLAKIKAARLGISMASDAVEVHGGNGYIEDWPVARIYRDAQVNTVWEGPDNIICLDVRRAMQRDKADGPLLDRIREAIENAGETDATVQTVAGRATDLRDAIAAWKQLEPQRAEARLFPLAQFMAEVYAGALLVEQAAWERQERGTDRKALVARLYASRYLGDADRMRGIGDMEDEALDRFEELLAGALAV